MHKYEYKRFEFKQILRNKKDFVGIRGRNKQKLKKTIKIDVVLTCRSEVHKSEANTKNSINFHSV